MSITGRTIGFLADAFITCVSGREIILMDETTTQAVTPQGNSSSSNISGQGSGNWSYVNGQWQSNSGATLSGSSSRGFAGGSSTASGGGGNFHLDVCTRIAS